jgi:Domain of unknown function (DUF5122) beta-propeller
MGMGRWGVRRYLLGTVGVAVTALTAGLLGPAPSASAAVAVDDTAKTSWQVDGTVYATVIVGNTVFVGGRFNNAVSTTGATVARRNLAAFSLSTGNLITGWRADANYTVRALATDGTSVYVGGQFTRLGGVRRMRVGKLNTSTGAVNGSFSPSFNGQVRALEVAGGFVYAGGSFSAVGGTNRTRLAKVNANSGALNSAFTASANNFVYGLRLDQQSGRLYVVGNFSNLSGSSRTGIGAVSSTSGSIVGPSFAYAVRPIFAVDVNEDGSSVFAATGSTSNAPVAWRTSNGSRRWRITTDGDVQAIRYYDGTVYFGFHDGYQGNTSLHALAADANSGAVDPAFRPTMVGFWGTWCIDATSAGVVLGGQFTRVSGVAHQGWARFTP